MKNAFSLLIGFSIPLLSAAALRAGEPSPAPAGKEPICVLPANEPPSSAFRISGGWMYRTLGGGEFRTGSRSQELGLPRFLGSGGRQDPDIGPAGAAGNRRYEDGFVNTDEGTVNDGATANWGYRSASQVQGDTLSYHASGGRREVGGGSFYERPDRRDFDAEGGAPVIQLDWTTEIDRPWEFGIQAQWSLLQVDDSHSLSNFSAFQTRDTFRSSFTDSYALQGVIPPAAPYEGSDAGNGPLIDNIPTARRGGEERTGGERVDLYNKISESLDVDVHTVSLGPVFGGKCGPVSLQAAAGLSLTIADWDASHRETLYLSRNGGAARELRRWTDRAGGTDVLPGFYFQGAASAPVTERLFVTAFGRYDWCEELEGKVGPSTFSLDLSGWSAGLMVGVRF